MIQSVKISARKTIIFLMIYMMVVNIVCSTFGIPSSVRYLSDVLAILLLVFLFKNFKDLLTDKLLRLPLIMIAMFLLWALISFFINWYSTFLLFWGLRNIGRFLVVFLCAALLLKKQDADKIYVILEKIYIINFVICVYQYFIQGYWADEIGGIFRLGEKGGNTGLLLLICVQTVYSFSNYLNKKTGFLNFVFVAASSMFIAGIAELKIYFVLFVLIILMSMLLNRVSGRTLLLVFVAIIGLCVGIYVMAQVAPESLKILNIEGMLEYIGGEDHGYSSSRDLSRMRAFEQITDMFFKDDATHKIFGFGLGSCDVSGINIFKSSFYENYSYLNYTWFMHGMLFLELGMGGIALFVAIFVSILICCFKFRKHDAGNLSHYNSAIIIAIISIITIWYNAGLRSDVSFFVYVCLALPFVYYRAYKENKQEMV